MVWNEYSVTFTIKDTYGQENLISQVVQPNSLDAKLDRVAQTDPIAMQDFWLQLSFGKSSQGGIFAWPIITQKLHPLCHFTSAAEK